MRRKLDTLFTIFCLFLTSIVTIATSKKGDHFSEPPRVAHYLVASNCPKAIPNEQISVVNGMITYPANIQPKHFGLPTNQINWRTENQISGLFNGQLRECLHSVNVDNSTSLDVYTCYENKELVCQVSFELNETQDQVNRI